MPSRCSRWLPCCRWPWGCRQAGSYTLSAVRPRQPARRPDVPYLRDAQTGHPAAAEPVGTNYAFSGDGNALGAGTAAGPLQRCSVRRRLGAGRHPGRAGRATVSLYPNPAREQATVAVPGLAGTSAVRVELLNALGQVVLKQQAALPASGTQLVLPTAGLATGVYIVRLVAGQLLVTKRLTIE